MNGFICIFYLWWLSVNAFSYYIEYTFFIRYVSDRKIEAGNLLLYIGINCLLTFFVLSTQMPIFLCQVFHASIMYLFMACFFIGRNIDIITPVIIIYSVSTFLEGISAVLMRWLVINITNPALGYVLQIALAAIFVFLFYLLLCFVERWFKASASQLVIPYIYILLLPCTFVIWVVRYGFGLDDLSNSNFPFANLSLVWALIAILSAAVTFFIILKVFKTIIAIAHQETEKALLNSQLEEQRIYIDEAQKRHKQLSSFQHDIDNHLSVLSGLLKEGKYSDLQKYFQKLQVSSASLRPSILTGNSVLDILLREKAGYAKQNHISISCNISLPPNLLIDEMDLCIIVSNALDNAIQECIKLSQDQPNIEIVIKLRHQFLLIEVTNPTLSNSMPIPGTGLKNIASAAKKYQGTMEFGKDNGRFRLSVLLCLEFRDSLPNTK